MTWDGIHISAVCAPRQIELLVSWDEILYQCPQDVKEAAWGWGGGEEWGWGVKVAGRVCPVLEYGSCVWNPQGVVLQQEIEKVQNRAARFVTINYCFETENDWNTGKTKMGVSQEKQETQ